MGYTHYYPMRPGTISEGTWELFTNDVQAILSHPTCPKVRRDEDSLEPPEVDGERVWFNGVGQNGYETFVLSRTNDLQDYEREERTFAFCKTDRRPYDAAVCAVLLAAADRLGDWVEVSSDGDWPEWAAGRALYEKATGRKAKKPPEVKAVG